MKCTNLLPVASPLSRTGAGSDLVSRLDKLATHFPIGKSQSSPTSDTNCKEADCNQFTEFGDFTDSVG